MTIYPALQLPPENTWVLTLEGERGALRPARWTPEGWTGRCGHLLKVRWWTLPPDEATRTGRDVLYVTGGLS